jgi:hypothetical protein
MKVEKIVYAAADENMGDCTPEDCDAYRAWAKSEIEAEYQDAAVEVTDDHTSNSMVVVDGDYNLQAVEIEDKKSEVHEFMSRLWDRCPWDFC